jgi:hypothetical protein
VVVASGVTPATPAAAWCPLLPLCSPALPGCGDDPTSLLSTTERSTRLIVDGVKPGETPNDIQFVTDAPLLPSTGGVSSVSQFSSAAPPPCELAMLRARLRSPSVMLPSVAHCVLASDSLRSGCWHPQASLCGAKWKGAAPLPPSPLLGTSDTRRVRVGITTLTSCDDSDRCCCCSAEAGVGVASTRTT